MKILKVVLVFILVAAIGAGVFVYFNAPEQKIVGKWESDYITFDFDKEGDVEITYLDAVIPGVELPVKGTYDGTYSIEKDDDGTYLEIHTTVTVILTVSLDFTYELEFEDGDMVLTPVYENGNGEEIEFSKKDA